MKHLISVIILTLSLGALTAQTKVSLSGTLDESYDLKEIYLKKYIGTQLYSFDTISVKKNKFKKKYDASFEKGLYALSVGKQIEEIVLVEEKVEIFIPKAIKDLPWKSTSDANLDYFNIRSKQQSYDINLSALDNHYKSFAHLKEAKPEYFNEQILELRKSLSNENILLESFFNDYVKEAKSDYGKKLANYYKIDATTTASNYLKKVDYSDNLLSKGDFIIRKLNYYFMRYDRIDPANPSLSAQTFLGYTSEKNLCRELMFEAIIRNMLTIDQKAAKSLQLQHKNEFGETEIEKRITAIMPVPAPAIGKKVPEILATNKDGKEFKLSELKGKVVLVDFWASWCGPCRRESPNVVANYEKFKDKGFTVVSISADKDRAKWVSAIDHDNYSWSHHILSAENSYKAQQDYQVRGYPTMFLIDREGNLVETGGNLRGANLEIAISNIINK